MILEQRLIPRSLTSPSKSGQSTATSVDEGVRASVMDPLWFLARQWQMGEFKAENCGSLASVDFESKNIPIDQVFHNIKPAADDPVKLVDENQPIEPLVDSSDQINQSNIQKCLEAPKSWKGQNLEYQFSIGHRSEIGANTLLQAKEYYGEQLDWYSFAIESIDSVFQNSKEHHVFPQPVRFPGMPKARWWQFEDEKIDLGDIQRTNLNYLSILLTEFALLYSNDWFIIPVQQPTGSLRKIESLSVYDVFGNTPISINPHVCSQNNGLGEQGFSIFSLTTDSSVLFLPNTLSQHIHGEALEEVIFSRDEMANLVWAIERRYYKGEDIINLEDGQTDSKPVQDDKPPKENSKIDQENLPQYKIMSPLRENWIPYISVQKPDNEQIYFRRGRTTKENGCQYKTEIITNSTRIWEEEIPTTPIVITQNAKMVVYDSEKWSFEKQDGNGKTVLSLKKDSGVPIRVIWIGRKKNRGIRQNSSDLKFDYLIE